MRFTVIITGQALSWESRFRHEFSPSLLSPIRCTFKNGCRLGEDRMSGLCWLGILIVILCLYTSSLGGTRLLTIKWVCFKQKLVNTPTQEAVVVALLKINQPLRTSMHIPQPNQDGDITHQRYQKQLLGKEDVVLQPFHDFKMTCQAGQPFCPRPDTRLWNPGIIQLTMRRGNWRDVKKHGR